MQQQRPPDPIRAQEMQVWIEVERLLEAAERARKERQRLLELIEAREAVQRTGGAA